MPGIMMHAAGVNRAYDAKIEDLATFEIPEQTKSYQPLPHLDMIEWILEDCEKFGLKPKPYKFSKVQGYDVAGNPIIEEISQPAQIGVTNSGHRMFFLIDFENDLLEHAFQIGGRNSYDKSLAAGVVAGARNFICDNTALSGQFQVIQKHMAGTDFRGILKDALSTAPRNIEKLIKNIDKLKDVHFRSEDEAKAFIVDACVKHQAIASSDIIPVWKEFETPTHEEFTEWGLSQYRMLQSLTEHNKKETSVNTSMNRYVRFAHVFGLDNDLN